MKRLKKINWELKEEPITNVSNSKEER